MAFFRKVFDEGAPAYPAVEASHNYVDAQALDLIRRPWDFDVMEMENMFGDILSDLGGGLVGGMGMAACAQCEPIVRKHFSQLRVVPKLSATRRAGGFALPDAGSTGGTETASRGRKTI